MVMLSAPPQAKSDVMPVEVPSSPLLDVTAPRSMSAEVRLNVLDTARAFSADEVQVVITDTNGVDLPGATQPGSVGC